MALNLDCGKTLNKNDALAMYNAIKALYEIANNICCFPTKPANTHISLGSDVVQNFLLPVQGAMECLFEMGFQEADDSLVLPPTTDISNVEKVRLKLQQKKYSMESVKFSVSPVSHNEFIQDLTRRHKKMSWLNDEGASNYSIKEIPLEFLGRTLEREEKHSKETFNAELSKLRILMIWFKDEFFEWVDKPQCPKCRISTQAETTNIVPSQSGTLLIEVYKCGKCGKRVEFPRHNEPEILLTTRKGRCGEWAICFTHMCRALNLDARIVYDSTDHVWTEVFIHSEDKWIHCDPCEGLIDAPLIYEAGWKKQLAYIFAYSGDEIQDVTWRYSSHHNQVLSRRRSVSEQQLAKFLTDYRVACLENKSEDRKKFVTERCLKELVSMMVEREPNSEDLCGRISGSMDWRTSRGEAGFEKHVWKILQKDLKNKTWNFGYSVTKDCYYVANKMVDKKWNCGISSNQNVFRKVEKDWNMAYLARNEGTNSAEISWCFQLDDGLLIDSIVIKFPVAVFSTGAVQVTLNSDSKCENVNTGGTFKTETFRGCQSFSVKAKLSGGDGCTAWQHAQLFRQNLNDNDIPFTLAVSFKN